MGAQHLAFTPSRIASLRSSKQLSHRHRRLATQTALFNHHHHIHASSIASPQEGEPSEDTSQTTTSGRPFESLLEDAERSIATQQAAGLSPPYDFIKTKRIVETAMLSAVTGLAYVIATLLKLEGYLSYILPLPIVISALDGGPAAGLKTVTVTFLLLFILMGPVRALTYLTVYGLLSLALGACWSLKLRWLVSVPVAAFAKIVGFGAYIGLSSWMTNENLVALMIASVHSLLDQLSGFLGTSGAPSIMVVSVTIFSLLLVNSLFYVFLMHILYTILLKSMGYSIGSVPRRLEKLVGASSTL